MDGDDSAVEQLPTARPRITAASDVEETRNRAAFYAVKLLGRLTGKIGAGNRNSARPEGRAYAALRIRDQGLAMTDLAVPIPVPSP